MPQTRPYRILSFDGGPAIRGSLLMLHEIERRVPGFLARTDFFVGTSSGSIAALFLGRQPKEALAPEHACDTLLAALDLVDEADDSFEVSLLRAARAVAGRTPLANQARLRALLDRAYRTDVFGNDLGGVPRLMDIPHHVGVLAYRLHSRPGATVQEGHGSAFLHTLYLTPPDEPRLEPVRTDLPGDSVESLTLTDLALRSGGLPMFLPSVDGHVDGAVFSNSPAMIALTSVLSKVGGPLSPLVRPALQDVRLFSAGGNFAAMPGALRGMGDVGWRRWLADPRVPLALLELMINANGNGQRDVLRGLMGGAYHRAVLPGSGQHLRTLLRILLGFDRELREEAIAGLRCFRECEFKDLENTSLETRVGWVRSQWMEDGTPKGPRGPKLPTPHRRAYRERTVQRPPPPTAREVARAAAALVDGTLQQHTPFRLSRKAPTTRELLAQLDDPARRPALCQRPAFDCPCRPPA